MASNDFLPFAYGGGANVLTQAEYAALTSILSGGYQSGVANSAQMNKTWRQSSIMSAVLAQFISDRTGQNAVDDGTTATLLANLKASAAALNGDATQTFSVASATALTHAPEAGQVQRSNFNYAGLAGGTANALTATLSPAPTSLTDYLIVTVRVAATNTGSVSLNVNGLGVVPVIGAGHQTLQGGELLAGGFATFAYSTNYSEAILLESTGGAMQVAPATASQHAVQLGQVAVFGSVRNLKATLAAAGTSITYTADAIVVKSALNGISTLLTSYSETLNIATTGAGGMDIGSAPASGYVAVYASWGAVPGAGIFAQNATSAVAPEQYGGANLPSGVTETQLIGVWPTNASGQLTIGHQRDRRHYIPAQVAFSGAPATGYIAVSLSSLVPKNAISVGGTTDFTGTSGIIIAYLAGDGAGTGEAHASFNGGQGASSAFRDVPMITAQTIFRALSGTGASQTAYISEYDI